MPYYDSKIKTPWTQYQPPFKVCENVYFVGTKWVSVFLIETEKGLVLIDCAMQEMFYLVVDSIHKMGFDPKNIKYLLLSHGHYDHCGAARSLYELSGCQIWLGKDDEYFFTRRRDLIFMEETVPQFPIHCFYNYDEVLDFGNIQITPVHCPGHTPGTTSFFFEVDNPGADGSDKKKLRCGFHGGLGELTLTDESLEENGFGLSMRKTFCESIDKVINEPVDIVLPSHVDHCIDYDFYGIAHSQGEDGRRFVDTDAWRRMLNVRKEAVLKLN